MASDVLDRAGKYINKPGTWTPDGDDTDALVKALAAEVRELRAKLAFLLSSSPDVQTADGEWTSVDSMEELEAAMASRGEDA